MIPKSVNDTDVFIVGAGPVGLFLANECARRGLRWQIVESHASQSQHSKALAIFPRTMEIFDMAGVAAPFLEKANRVTSIAILRHGRKLAQMKFQPENTPYPFVAMVPQATTEQILVEALRKHGGAVEYETTFVSATHSEGRVNVQLQRDGKVLEVTASFLVGCDGAHSAVRHSLNLPFEGGEYEDSFMLADVETNDFLLGSELQLCPSEMGPVAIFPMSSTRRRIVAVVDQPPNDEAPTLDLVQKILRERGPKDVEAHALHWSTYFRIHHRHVANLRLGRIFLAGDAAHIHSPFGGQGMNTGLHDVWNLIWKVDLCLHGWGTEQLLESYTIERIPIIKQVIGTTDFLTKVMATPNKFAQALRDAVIPMVSHLAPFQHAFVQRLSELGIAYHGSPIIEGPGTRYLDESLRGGEGIRSRFVMMLGRDVKPAAASGATVLAASFNDLVEVRSTAGHGIVLVRPDGYLAYSSDDNANPGALEPMRTLLERQTKHLRWSTA